MNLPESYAARIRTQIPDADAYFDCLDDPPARGVRVNELKITPQDFLSRGILQTDGAVPWAEGAFYIRDEKPGRSLYFAAGLFYVQEPSAACAAPLLGVRPGERVLDLCAAPGGKSAQLACAMRGEGLLVLNEKIPARAAVLSENAERMGIPNAVVLSADPGDLEERFSGYFDKILVDAPCSGEGMFRKEPAALAEWSEANVAMCAARQRRILHSAAKMLRGGGRLVYSTCTFSEDEDERNAARFAADEGFTLIASHKLWPHRVRGEGHYAALFEKEGGSAAPAVRRRGELSGDRRAAALWHAFEKENLLRPLQGRLLSFGSALYLVPEDTFPLDGLKVLRAGIRLGEAANGRFVPSHALAAALPRGAFAAVNELTREEAEMYLRGGEVPSRCAKGWCAAAYDGFVLGWGRSAGEVMKNKYPKALRRAF